MVRVMKQETNNCRNTERGMALITSLLATTMMLALGMAVVLSATTDTVTTKAQRVGEQSFFVADAGVGIGRRALEQALSEEIEKIRNGTTPFYSNPPASGGQFPDVQVIPAPVAGSWNAQPDFYKRVKARADELVRNTARDQEFDQLNGSNFSVSFSPLTGSLALVKQTPNQATQVVLFHYAIQVTGRTTAGGSATVNETGRLSTNINLAYGPPAGSYRNFSFSGFGAFFDVGDDPNHLNYVLVPGTFSGPVHTNSHFAFYTGWQYTFRNAISQVDDNIRLYYNTFVPIPTSDYAGSIHLSAEGYKKVSRVALPTNNFSQEYAVINSTGITDKKGDGTPLDPPAVIPVDGSGNPLAVLDSNGRVTVDALVANLRNAQNNPPSKSGSALANGVYISSSDGSTISGAGIYVQGDADDIKLYGDTNGDQVYVITQGGTATTIRESYTSNTTTVSSGSSTRTYSGLPTDKSDPDNPKQGVSLYVNGGITSLRGGKEGSTTRPALASSTALTITAKRSIKVTGDLKYADPVVNSDGTPVSNIATVKNVLGLFTNDGNIYLDAKTNYVANADLSIEVDAANCVFDSDTSNNSQAPYTGQEGGITTWFGSGHQTPTSSARIRLVGSDVEKNNSLVDYYNGDTYFDVRFSGGGFRPPFFPGTTYALGPPPVAGVLAISSVDQAASTAKSWFRDSN